MDWKQWVLWLVGLLMDRWVEIAVGVVVITVWRWFMGRKFDRQAIDHKKQIDALAAAVTDRSQTSPTVVVNVGEHEPEAVDRTSGDREAVKINPGNGWRVARLILVWCLTNTLMNLRVLLAVGCVALPRVVTATARHRALPTTKMPSQIHKRICETPH